MLERTASFHKGPADDALLAVLAAAACPLPCPGHRTSDGEDWHARCEDAARRALDVLRPAAAVPLAPAATGERLPWALWWGRCSQVRRPAGDDLPHGRCELRAGHDGEHALSRWDLVLRFSGAHGPSASG